MFLWSTTEIYLKYIYSIIIYVFILLYFNTFCQQCAEHFLRFAFMLENTTCSKLSMLPSTNRIVNSRPQATIIGRYENNHPDLLETSERLCSFVCVDSRLLVWGDGGLRLRLGLDEKQISAVSSRSLWFFTLWILDWTVALLFIWHIVWQTAKHTVKFISRLKLHSSCSLSALLFTIKAVKMLSWLPAEQTGDRLEDI